MVSTGLGGRPDGRMEVGGFVSLLSDLGFALSFFWPMAGLPLAPGIRGRARSARCRTLYYRPGPVKNTRFE
jgi:hypothetical protein